jgi:hypothetical protein
MLFLSARSIFTRNRPRISSFGGHSKWKLPRVLQYTRYSSTVPVLPNTALFRALRSHDPSSRAIVRHKSQHRFTYGNLLHDVANRSEILAETANGRQHLVGQRVAFLADPGYDYVGIVFLFSYALVLHWLK